MTSQDPSLSQSECQMFRFKLLTVIFLNILSFLNQLRKVPSRIDEELLLMMKKKNLTFDLLSLSKFNFQITILMNK